MVYYHFIWTDEATEKVTERGLTEQDVEFVISYPITTVTSASTGRPIAFGYTEGGEWIACVYEIEGELDVIPITAYQVDE